MNQLNLDVEGEGGDISDEEYVLPEAGQRVFEEMEGVAQVYYDEAELPQQPRLAENLPGPASAVFITDQPWTVAGGMLWLGCNDRIGGLWYGKRQPFICVLAAFV